MMAIRKSPRPNASRAESSVFDLNSEKHRLPSSDIELTAKERASLKDPNWIDEDEADRIVCQRREKEPGNKAIPFREYLRQRGIKVDR